MRRVRTMKVVKIMLVAALIMSLAAPAMAGWQANWQALGWAFFGLSAFNSLVATSAYASGRPYPYGYYGGYYAPPAYYPAPAYYYPYGYYRPYGYWRPYGRYYRGYYPYRY